MFEEVVDREERHFTSSATVIVRRLKDNKRSNGTDRKSYAMFLLPTNRGIENKCIAV